MVLGLKSADNIQAGITAGHEENSLNPHWVALLITVPCKDNHLDTHLVPNPLDESSHHVIKVLLCKPRRLWSAH